MHIHLNYYFIHILEKVRVLVRWTNLSRKMDFVLNKNFSCQLEIIFTKRRKFTLKEYFLKYFNYFIKYVFLHYLPNINKLSFSSNSLIKLFTST